MTGKNIVWVAKQHGHSVAMSTEVCGTWFNGAGEDEVARIEAAMNAAGGGLGTSFSAVRVTVCFFLFFLGGAHSLLRTYLRLRFILTVKNTVNFACLEGCDFTNSTENQAMACNLACRRTSSSGPNRELSGNDMGTG